MRPKKHTLKVPQQDGFVPVSKALADLPGPLKALCKSSPQALHHFTQADQIDQLIKAREAEPDLGFMARLMTLCSLPRTNPGKRKEYVRRNGPYTLVMSAGGLNKLPYGNLPRLLLAWVCTEAVRTQNRVLVLGKSLSEFMRTLGIKSTSGGVRGEQTRLRNQMRRLFGCTVQLAYNSEQGDATVTSLIARRTAFWWNARKPNQSSLWESEIELSQDFFDEITRHPIPLDMNTLKALKRSTLGLDLYLWVTYRTFTLRAPLRITWRQLYRQFGADPAKASDHRTVQNFRAKVLQALTKIGKSWTSLNYSTDKGALIIKPSTPLISAKGGKD